MTVAALSAENLPSAATPPLEVEERVDLRTDPAVRAGTFAYDGPDLVTGWHTHGLHQIEYAFAGVAEVETPTAHYLLPPQQAVWVPAGLPHNTTLRGVRSVSVFLDPAMVPAPADRTNDRARVVAAAPVMREMLVYALRWPIDRPGSDRVADAFFDALALLTIDWLDHELPLALPTSTDPVVAAVMAFTNAHLEDVTVQAVGHAVGISERTLRRRFPGATGMTWREYLLQARLLRAMALLAESGEDSVVDVAHRVGFGSVSAFTRAFRTATGDTPAAYRRAARSPETGPT